MNRRDVLKLGSLAMLGTAVTTTAGAAFASPARAATVQWPGHKPGKIYIGACGDNWDTTVSRTGALGLQRSFYRWGDGAREDKVIRANHAAGRMPWISFKPPIISGGWLAVASGKYDADIRARARRYAALSKPVIVTFNHEPQNDQEIGTPAEFVKAWIRIHDIMKSETGLKNVVSAPIIGEWVWNPINKRDDPETLLTRPMLDRCHFVGLDVYQTKNGATYDTRLGRVFDYMDAKGHPTKMVGIGETGATNYYGTPTGAAWWASSWKFAAANTSRVGAISYFNSLANNNSGCNWMLWETQAKLDAFKASLRSSVVATLGASTAGTTTTTATTVSTPEPTAETVTVASSAPVAAVASDPQHQWGSRWQYAV